MKVRYNFYLTVIALLHLPYLSRAVMLPHKPLGLVNSAPRLLYAVQDGCNGPSSDKADEAGLLHKTMRIQAMIQRSWLTSMVVPGLGQVYNKDYWKVPCLYLGFVLVGSRIYSEHQEMNNHKRTLFMSDDDKRNPIFTEKRIKECERTRNLFIIIASAWYLLNIFDAYAGGHDKTVNFKNDIGTKPTSPPPVLLQPAVATNN